MTKKTYAWYVSDASGVYPDIPTEIKDYDDATFIHTFSGVGTYKVKVIADNCYSQTKESNEITVTVTTSPDTNPNYTITGTTCYDIAQTAPLTDRTNAFASTHTMSYDFNYTGNYSTLEYHILEDSQSIISAVGLPASGTTSGTGNGTRTFTVTFANVKSSLVGQTAAAVIAASFKDNSGNPIYALLSITVKDETCCAYVRGSDGRCYRSTDNRSNYTFRVECPTGWSPAAWADVRTKTKPSDYKAWATIDSKWVYGWANESGPTAEKSNTGVWTTTNGTYGYYPRFCV